MSDQLRVDRGSVQNHVDDTRSNMTGFRGAHEQADRQTASFAGQTEGGVGSEDINRTRAAANRHSTEIDGNVNKLMNRTSENTDEFISNVRNAATRSLNTTD
jgi:hypothetical protein